MNRALYKTVYAEAEYEFYEKKSRFIAGIRPVESIDAAKDFISKIKLEHPKATHNVPAFVVGNNMEHTWASDDGEPSSSAGRPMLNLLINEGLTNVVVVATRYFGGIKLGKGGLVRAYTAVCKGAVEKACIAAAYSMIKLNVVISHKDYSLIRRNEGKAICEIVDGDVSAEVIATDYEGMIREGEELAALHPQIVVKVPCTAEGIKAIKYFSDKGIRTNCTLNSQSAQSRFSLSNITALAAPAEISIYKYKHHKQLWSGKRDSNPRHLAWEASALPLSYSRTTAKTKMAKPMGFE